MIVLPVRIVRMAGGFRIVDAEGKSICYIYGAEPTRQSPLPGMMSMAQAQQAAQTIARALTAVAGEQP